MQDMTKRQAAVLKFIEDTRARAGHAPTFREISEHFGFSSPNAARDHVLALERKGRLVSQPGKARTLRAAPPAKGAAPSPKAGEVAREPAARYPARPEGLMQADAAVVRVPVYGSIPAGFAEDRWEEPELGCVSVDIRTLGIRAGARTFALRVRGDSMIGRHICDGDIVVCEHGVTPRPGAVVAALIDNESTLKTYVLNRGKPYLKAENPRFPDLLPAHELVIQGVVVSVLRTFKAAG